MIFHVRWLDHWAFQMQWWIFITITIVHCISLNTCFYLIFHPLYKKDGNFIWWKVESVKKWKFFQWTSICEYKFDSHSLHRFLHFIFCFIKIVMTKHLCLRCISLYFAKKKVWKVQKNMQKLRVCLECSWLLSSDWKKILKQQITIFAQRICVLYIFL